MAFNGTGTHNRVHDWTQDLANSVPVTASRMDADSDDFSTALSNTICRDGQSTTTARIPFASGVSAAAGSTSAAAYAQTSDLNTGLYFPGSDQWGLAAGGTAVLTGTNTGVSVTGTFGVSGAVTLSSSLGLTGDLAINTNKFTVTAASGNTAVAGTLAVTGAATLSSTLGVTGDFAVNTNKFTVAASSGNTSVAGTLGVTGNATLSGTLGVTGAVTLSSTAAITGNTTVGGTLAVTGLMTGRIPLLHVRDEKTSGTEGGAFTSGAWQTRTLNTVVTNEITGASLGSNQITLPAGTYEIEARAPAFIVASHKAKLANVTDTSDIIIGSTENSRTDGAPSTISFVSGRFTLSAQKVVELQHRCETTRLSDGFGSAASFGVAEVYAEVLIHKVA